MAIEARILATDLQAVLKQHCDRLTEDVNRRTICFLKIQFKRRFKRAIRLEAA